MQKIFHTPEGVRDIYGEECRQEAQNETAIAVYFRNTAMKR